MQNIKNSLSGKISGLINHKMKELKITGAAVSIVHGDETLFSKGFGFADKANKIPADNSTVFKIGSITKVFTASAVMRLAEEGKIDIDKPVRDYIPEFSVKSRFPDNGPVIIRDILCHHSGLPSDNFKDYFSQDPEAFQSVTVYLKNACMPYPSGKMFYYSNLGYELLGVLISRVSGMPYHKYIEDVLLKGLGMTRSSIVLPDDMKKDLSKPYASGREQNEPLMMKEVPPGGIFSNADDMAVFMKAVLNGGRGLFTKQNTLNMMFTPQYPENPIDMSYVGGLGWFTGKPGLDYAGKVIWHDGGTPNFFSLTVLIPERKLGITLLTNSASGALMNHQVSIDILGLIVEDKYGIKPPGDENRTLIKLTPEIIRKSAGRFISLSGIVNIKESGSKLIAMMPSGNFLMLPCRDGWFNVKLLLFGFLPLSLKQLSMIRLGIVEINGERIFAMEQLGFRSPQGGEFRSLNTTEAWKKWTGDYICSNEENPRLKNFKLSYSPDGLVLSASTGKMGRLKLYLDAVNDSEAVITGFGRYSGETISVSGEKINLFGLEFERIK